MGTIMAEARSVESQEVEPTSTEQVRNWIKGELYQFRNTVNYLANVGLDDQFKAMRTEVTEMSIDLAAGRSPDYFLYWDLTGEQPELYVPGPNGERYYMRDILESAVKSPQVPEWERLRNQANLKFFTEVLPRERFGGETGQGHTETGISKKVLTEMSLAPDFTTATPEVAKQMSNRGKSPYKNTVFHYQLEEIGSPAGDGGTVLGERVSQNWFTSEAEPIADLFRSQGIALPENPTDLDILYASHSQLAATPEFFKASQAVVAELSQKLYRQDQINKVREFAANLLDEKLGAPEFIKNYNYGVGLYQQLEGLVTAHPQLMAPRERREMNASFEALAQLDSIQDQLDSVLTHIEHTLASCQFLISELLAGKSLASVEALAQQDVTKLVQQMREVGYEYVGCGVRASFGGGGGGLSFSEITQINLSLNGVNPWELMSGKFDEFGEGKYGTCRRGCGAENVYVGECDLCIACHRKFNSAG